MRLQPDQRGEPSPAVGRPAPVLGVADAAAMVVGIVVGAGIFRTPSVVAEHAGSLAALVLAWVAGGVVSLLGALCYAELASAYPHAGGEYHFLSRAYGPRLAFFLGWGRLAVIQTGSIALLGFVFGDYVSRVIPLGPRSSSVWAAIVIAGFTAVNVAGVRHGSRTQNALTALELLGIGALIVAGFVVRPAAAAGVAPAAAPPAFGLVMIFVLLTYGGWNEAAYLSAELRRRKHAIVHALVWSLALITALYLLVNLALVRALGLRGMAGSTAVAADLARLAGGEAGAIAISLLVGVSVLTSLNGTIFTGARTSYALGGDVAVLGGLGRWHAGTGTPRNALLAQGAVALALVGLGTLARRGFETMVEYTAPVFWFFVLLVAGSLFILRIRDRETPRPFRVPGYPLTPALFAASAGYLLYSSLVHTGIGALAGVAVLALGGLILSADRGRAAVRPPASQPSS